MKAYTDKTRYLFVQLRARGISLGVISTQLDVPKSTLGDWDKSFADEIARLRAIEWEGVEEKFGRTLEQDLCAMAERIRKWEARIDRMNPDHFKVREVLAVLRETRREYFRRRAILMAPLDNTLTRAVTRSLSRHPDEAGRYTFLPSTPLHNTNDLQQPPAQPSGCGGNSVEPTSVTSDVRRGPISPDTRDNNNGHSADAACDSAPSDATVQQPVVPNLSCPVTPDVRRGLTSPETLDSTTARSANAAQDQSPIQTLQCKSDPVAASNERETPTNVRMLSPLPRAAETQSLGENDDPKLGQGEGQTSSSRVSLPAAIAPSSIPSRLHSLEIPPESELQKEYHLSASR